MAGAERVSFESGGDFMRETRREVEAYLASRSTRRAGYARLYAKVPVAIGLTAISWSLLLVGPSHLATDRGVFRRAGARRGSHGLLRSARREPRSLLSQDALQPPGRLDVRCAPRSLELRLACQAQRRAPHVHQHRRARCRHHADAGRQAGPCATDETVVSLSARLRLAALRLHGPAPPDDRRPLGLPSRQHRKQRPARAAPLGSRRVHRRQDRLRHLDAPDTAAVPPLVDRARLVRRHIALTQLHDGDGLSTRALRRGSREPVPRGTSLDGRRSGRSIRSSPRSTSAPTTPS